MALLAPLQRQIADLLPALDQIADERRPALDALARFVADARADGRIAPLVFICTHNSRRSHMAQLWAAAAAAQFGLGGTLTSFSGGTEATAFEPRAVAAMRRAGFEITADATVPNPRYRACFADTDGPDPGCPACVEVFSKIWDAPSNPREGFAAVMTCTDADEACPLVAGAALRVALPYADPKQADGSPEEAATYDARARQIAVEMLYLARAAAAGSPRPGR